MKKLLILFLFSTVLNAQLLTLFDDDVMSYFALDMDGSTEYAYINSPTGLDLNSANYLSGTDDDFTATYVSNFSSGTDSWNTYYGSLAGNASAHGQTQLLKIDGHTNGFFIVKPAGILSVGKLFKVKFIYYLTTSAITPTVYFRDNLNINIGSFTSKTNQWDTVTVNLTGITNAGMRILCYSSITASDTMYIKTINTLQSNWDNISFTGTKATFSSTATLATSYLSTSFVSGKNYTVQLKVSSLASSDLKIKVGSDSTTLTTTGTETTKAWTFNYTDGDEIELIGNGTDTYTIDDVDVSEAYDLEIEGWFRLENTVDENKRIYFVGNDWSNRYDLYINPSEELTIGLKNNGVGSNSSGYGIDTLVWYNFKSELDNLNKTYKLYLSNSLIGSYSNFETWNLKNISKLIIGNDGVAFTQEFNGQVGSITFTRTNGLGETVGTSIYDWKGDADTYPDDKGSNGNDLIIVNNPSRYKYKNGYTGTGILVP